MDLIQCGRTYFKKNNALGGCINRHPIFVWSDTVSVVDELYETYLLMQPTCAGKRRRHGALYWFQLLNLRPHFEKF